MTKAAIVDLKRAQISPALIHPSIIVYAASRYDGKLLAQEVIEDGKVVRRKVRKRAENA